MDDLLSSFLLSELESLPDISLIETYVFSGDSSKRESENNNSNHCKDRNETSAHHDIVDDTKEETKEEVRNDCEDTSRQNSGLCERPCGLTNEGYLCYANAILQALNATKLFQKFILDTKLHVVDDNPNVYQRAPLLKRMSIIFFALHVSNPMIRTNGISHINATELLREVLDLDPLEQRDAEEFMCCILNRMIYECQDMIMRDADANNNAPPLDVASVSLPTPMVQVFQGKLVNSITKMFENEESTTTTSTENFLTLKLNVQDCTTIYESLTKYFTPTNVEMTRDGDVRMSHSTRILHLPRILVLHLKIFQYKEQSHKIISNYQISEKITIPAEFLSESCKNAYHERLPSYKLFAVVSHIGNNADTGHYICEAFDPLMKAWYCYDDINVTPITVSDVIRRTHPYTCLSSIIWKVNIDHHMPYLLFFEESS